MLVIHRLTEVTNDPTLQNALPGDLIRISGNEDRRNRVARIYEMSVELNSSHARHLNVADQARGFSEERRCQEIGRRRKRFDGVAQRRHEFPHGFAKGLIVLDDRDQCRFRHRRFSFLCPRHTGAVPMPRACSGNVGEGSRQSNAGDPKRWLMRSAIRLGKGAVRVDGL
jgi:hypothetical protein